MQIPKLQPPLGVPRLIFYQSSCDQHIIRFVPNSIPYIKYYDLESTYAYTGHCQVIGGYYSQHAKKNVE